MAHYPDYFIRLLGRATRSAVPRRTLRTATPVRPSVRRRTSIPRGAVQRLHRAFQERGVDGRLLHSVCPSACRGLEMVAVEDVSNDRKLELIERFKQERHLTSMRSWLSQPGQ